MNNNFIETFIDKVYALTGLECYYDGLENEYDEYEFFFGDEQELGIILNEDFSQISVFTSFSYYDYKISEIKQGLYDPEELEWERRTRLLEKLFYIYAQNNNTKFPVSLTDDGNYMCPGFVSRVGYINIPYCETAISDFAQIIKEFNLAFGKMDSLDLTQEVVKRTFKKYGIYLPESKECIINRYAKILFTDSRLELDNNVGHYYLGKEHFIFECNEKNYIANIEAIKIFIEVHDDISMFSELTYSFCENKLYIVSEYMVLICNATIDNGIYSKIEENMLLLKTSSFIPFAGEKFKKVFFENFFDIMNDTGSNPLIITEGTTDWIHLKKHWNIIKNDFRSLNISFWEYYPPGTLFKDKPQQTMGGTVLLEMCKAYSKLEQNRIMIFIADCDDKRIVNEMGDLSKGYKEWSKNVYSMTLPIPSHRESEKELCIEHLYTDDEIRQFYLCDDGIERRLYLGKDFDEFGRCIKENKLCTKRNLCGINSIKVIDGSSDCKVVSANSFDMCNYALSKFDFAEKVSANRNSQSFSAFLKVFSIINKIVYTNNNEKSK